MSDPRDKSEGEKADEQLAELLSGGEDFADPALLLKVSYPRVKDDDDEESIAVILRMFKPGVGAPRKVEGWMMEVLQHAQQSLAMTIHIVGARLLQQQIEGDQKRRKAEQRARANGVLPPGTFDPGMKQN